MVASYLARIVYPDRAERRGHQPPLRDPPAIAAARAAQLGATRLRRDLVACAAAAARARHAWLAAARAWYHVKTDAPGELSQAAAETANLAQWTGRLTYADPGWTLTSTPGDYRSPQHLAPDPRAFTHALTAVHQAASTLTTLATTDYTQIHAAARNGRLYVPAVQVRGSVGSADAYTRAPRRVSIILLAAYRDAGTASVMAADKISRIAAQHNAADGQATRSAAAPPGDRPVPGHVTSAMVIDLTEPDPPPGPVERIIADLGVAEPDLLNRGRALDKSVIQLIADAADRTAPQRWHTAVTRPGAATNPSAVARHVLAADHPAPAVKLRTSLRALAAGSPPTGPDPRARRQSPALPSQAREPQEWLRAS